MGLASRQFAATSPGMYDFRPAPDTPKPETYRQLLDAADALTAADRGEIDVIFPTRRNLERLAQFDDFSEARAHAEATPMHTIVPFIEDGPQGRSLCIRGDCGYPVTSVLLDEAKRG